MPKGDKSKYTQKQKRQAKQIEQNYQGRSMPRKEASSRTWAIVNKETAGGKDVGGVGRAKAASRKASSVRGRMAVERGQSGRSATRSAVTRKPASRKAASRSSKSRR
jgi:hypothetical protein